MRARFLFMRGIQGTIISSDAHDSLSRSQRPRFRKTGFKGDNTSYRVVKQHLQFYYYTILNLLISQIFLPHLLVRESTQLGLKTLQML